MNQEYPKNAHLLSKIRAPDRRGKEKMIFFTTF